MSTPHEVDHAEEKASAPATAPAAPSRSEWRSGLRWFAAEFLVVVSGVLVALLVNAWWTGRESRGRELQTLARLHEESESVVRYLRSHIAWNDSLFQAKEAAVAMIEGNGIPGLDLEGFRQAVFFAFTYPATNPPRSVYDEVTESGRFGTLSSVPVRSAIAAYYGRLDWLQSQLVFFRQTAQPGIELTMQYPYAYDPAAPERMRVLVEPAALRRDPRVRHALIFGLRNQAAFQVYRTRVYDDAVVMCETLAETLGRTCEAAR